MAASSPTHDEFIKKLLNHQRQLYAYIVSLLPYGDDADEVYQQTCLVLWQKWEQFDPAAEFLTLACGVAHNEMRNHVRRKDRNPLALSQEVLEQLAERRIETSELRARRIAAVVECLGQMPVADQALIEEVYVSQKPTKDIAGNRGVTPGSLYTKVHRLRRQLMQCADRILAEEVRA